MLGIKNLCYALIAKQSNIRFYIDMSAGLLFAFLGALIFLLFCPLLTIEVPIFKAVYIVYALIISFILV